MSRLKHKNSKGEIIVFDDYVDDREEYGIFYVYMCEECKKKYFGNYDERLDNGGYGWCSVEGCTNEAEYYVDFLPE